MKTHTQSALYNAILVFALSVLCRIMNNCLFRYATYSHFMHNVARLEEFPLAVKIRLARFGAKKRPYYRVVVADSRMPRDGRHIDEVGRYNPMTTPKVISLDLEKIDEWIAKGAQPSSAVSHLIDIVREGQPVQEKKVKKSKKQVAKEAEAAEAAKAAAEAAAAEAEEAAEGAEAAE